MIPRTRSRRTTWLVLGVTHLWAASVTLLALRIFLTPAELIHTAPPQPVRYAVYALVAFALGTAAGTVLGVFLTRRSWLPVVYLWAVPLTLILYPAIDSTGARYLYVAVTSRVAGVLAVAASVLWVLGIAAGLLLVLRLAPARER